MNKTKRSTEKTLKKVEKLLETGYNQILIRNGNVYASGGTKLITEEDIENAPLMPYLENQEEN